MLALAESGRLDLLARGADGGLGDELPCDDRVPCSDSLGASFVDADAGPAAWYLTGHNVTALVVTAAGARQGQCVGLGTGCRYMATNGDVVRSPDGRTLYVGSLTDIQVVLADRAPVCRPAVLEGWVRSTSTLKPSCSDPNADPVTFAIVTQPAGGGLSATADGLRYAAPATVSVRTATVAVSDGSNVVNIPVRLNIRPTPTLHLSIDGARLGRGRAGRVAYAVPFGKPANIRISAPSGAKPMPSIQVRMDLTGGDVFLGATDASGSALIRRELFAPGTTRVRAPSLVGVRPLVVELAMIPYLQVTHGSDHKIRGVLRPVRSRSAAGRSCSAASVPAGGRSGG